jgi:hypothetical protein
MSYLRDLEDFLLVSEKRLELMERMPGEYLEFINLKKLNSLLFVIQKIVGMSSIKWSELLKNFTNL